MFSRLSAPPPGKWPTLAVPFILVVTVLGVTQGAVLPPPLTARQGRDSLCWG